MNRIFCCALIAAGLFAQPPPADMSDAESESLRQALGEAGNSPVDFVRAVESHLAKYPESPRKLELERAIVKAATDLKDDGAIVKYGQRILEKEPDDARILERVSTSLLRKGDKADAERALKYVAHLREILKSAVNDKPASGRDEVKLREGADRANARALLLQARAEGLLEHAAQGAELAELSFAVYPNVEAAREASRWLAANGNTEAAIRYLAKAFAIAEMKSTDPEGARDRIQMGDLYKKWKGTDTGLGDMLLHEYDQTSAAFAARRERLKSLDPNSDARDPMQFTLSGVSGDALQLASLKGKVIVMDFWATWCGPCRIQHPLYEKVKGQFKDRGDVVFLAIDTDEERSLVKPFLEQNQWSQKVYFEDGLGSLLKVDSIPTTVIFNKKGEVSSRMNGFLPERFVEMLTERIHAALQEPSAATVARR